MKFFFQILVFFSSFTYLLAETDISLFLPKESQTIKVHWLDLPNDSLEKLGNVTVSTTFVNQLIQQYHSIEKTDPSKLTIRISYLKEITDAILILVEQESDPRAKKFLNNIYLTAEEKERYLEALDAMRLKLSMNPDYIQAYMLDVEGISGNRTPLFLVNKRAYDSKLRIYWGEYYLEVIDPCHRFLTSYYDAWLATNPTNNDYFSFFIWLEGQSVHFEVTSVRYFSNSEKSQCEAFVKEGKLVKRINNEILTCCQKNKEYLFTIDLDERFYIVKGEKGIRHTSLSHGKPVFAAGNILIKEGIIYRLGLESGHYQPTLIDAKQLLDILHGYEVTFSPDAVIDFYHNEGVHTLTLAEFERLLED